MNPIVKQDVKYLCLWCRVLLSILIVCYFNSFAQPKSLFNLLFAVNQVEAFFYSVLLCWLLIGAIQQITLFLDARFTWEEEPVKRLIYQLLAGVGAVLLLIYLLLKFLFGFTDVYSHKNMHLTVGFPLVQALVLVVNTIYACVYFAQRFFVAESPAANPAAGQEHLTVTLGRKTYFIATEEIAYMLREDKVGYAVLKCGKRLNMAYKMDELEEILDPGSFVRINRSVIYAIDLIEGYRNEKNAQCSLIIKSGYPVCHNLLVSRGRTPKVKLLLDRTPKTRIAG